ncbi:hypothetical protein [Cetobacterium sp. SF1]|uniref:hypothetical protein n=1 Tax=Cetobacterium sp. SF1 TaxID=3417654 RepID=UPI003CF92762
MIKREVHEECINHRFAIYLENEFKYIIKNRNLSVDVEYNKNGKSPKIYGSEDKKFRPDIIIHERNSNRNNYIVIEAKKSKLSKSDKEKLINCKNKPYNYDIALGLEYGVRKNYFTLYFYDKDGNYEKIKISNIKKKE